MMLSAFNIATIRKVDPQVILVNNLYVVLEVGLYSFNSINLSNFNQVTVDIEDRKVEKGCVNRNRYIHQNYTTWSQKKWACEA